MYNTDPENIEYIVDFLSRLTDPQRKSELSAIKQASVTVHALVIQELDKMRAHIKMEKDASAMSPIRLTTIVADQAMSYTRGDLRKLAMDIKNKVPRAEEAFHYIYNYITGR